MGGREPEAGPAAERRAALGAASEGAQGGGGGRRRPSEGACQVGSFKKGPCGGGLRGRRRLCSPVRRPKGRRHGGKGG